MKSHEKNLNLMSHGICTFLNYNKKDLNGFNEYLKGIKILINELSTLGFVSLHSKNNDLEKIKNNYKKFNNNPEEKWFNDHYFMGLEEWKG